MKLLNGRAFARLGAGAIAAAAAGSFVAMAGVAQAAVVPNAADVEVSVAGGTFSHASKNIRVTLTNKGPATAVGVQLTIDASDFAVNNKVSYEFNGLQNVFGDELGDCEQVANNANKFACTLEDIAPGANVTVYPITIERVRENRTATLKVETSAQNDTNVTNNKAQTQVTLVRPGFDLVAYATDVEAYQESRPLKPGEVGVLFWALQNKGSRAVQGVKWEISLPPYTSFASPVSEACKYNDKQNVATCQLDDVILEPGDAIAAFDDANRLTESLIKVAPNAPGPITAVGGVVSGNGIKGIQPTPEYKSQAIEAPTFAAADVKAAKRLKVAVVKASDLNRVRDHRRIREADPSDNSAKFSVKIGPNKTDLTPAPTTFKGRVGETVKATVAVSNQGPSDAVGSTVKVTAPAGTELLETPLGCAYTAAKKDVTCDTGTLEAGKTLTGVFTFKITSKDVAAGKTVVASKNEDRDAKNNEAPITVTVLPGAAPGPGGGLPVTGAQAGVIGGVGAAVLALGAGLFMVARRRRVHLVTPSN